MLAAESLPKRKLAVELAQSRDEQLHHVCRAEGMTKARVLGSWEGQASEPQLTNSSQALHLGGVEQAKHDGLLVALEADKTVNGIA